MCNLMGREPSPELVARVQARYNEIGGSSPLIGIAQQLAEGVSAALASSGMEMPVEVGMCYWRPSVAEAIDALAGKGVQRVLMVSLSPYKAAVTHGEYRSAMEAAAAPHGMVVLDAPVLSELPIFVELQLQAAATAMAELGDPSAPVLFTAHSLPCADVEHDDSYVRGLQAAAEAVARGLGLAPASAGSSIPGVEAFGTAEGPHPWLVAYQSRGARGGQWLGPDVEEVIDAVSASGGSGVIVVPLGFATDHMETLYDLDVVARKHAAERGVAFVRSALPNAHPAMAAGIAHAAREMLLTSE